jgi:competence protein ComEC
MNPDILSGNKKTDDNTTTKPIETSPITTHTSDTTSNDGSTVEGVIYDDFQIHFMTLGNSNNGDCIYVKAGDNDILIDAGSNTSSYSTTKAYINQYCKDSKFEYVIATHGDSDHVACFPKFANDYTFETIITNKNSSKTTTTYKNMESAFKTQVSNGASWVYAGDCFNNINGAQSSYKLSDTVSMNIIYNKYYWTTTSNENDYSVCLLFEYNDNVNKHYFMLNGDLEADGEQSIADYYDKSTEEKTLPHCDLFKAGHHGSKTSSNESLLDVITPDIVTISCVAGSTEYTKNYNNTFPTQAAIDRIAKYTDRVYATSYYNTSTSSRDDLNGNIIISCNGNVGVYGSNNLTKLKDTEWFNETIYVTDYEEKDENGVPNGKVATATTTGAVAVKQRIWPSNN